MIFADMFSIFFTILLLVGFVIYFLAPDFISETRQEEIIIKESIYGNENIFILKAFLNTPIQEGDMSDLINLWLQDDSYEARLIEVSQGIFDKVYGDCYALTIGNNIHLGNSLSTGHLGTYMEYPNYRDSPLLLAIDISEYDQKFEEGDAEECF